MTKDDLHKFDIVYHARILPSLGIYDLNELKIRTVEEDYFVGTDKHSKRAHLFSYDDIGKNIFINRSEALDKVKEAEANRKDNPIKETYYEEY